MTVVHGGPSSVCLTVTGEVDMGAKRQAVLVDGFAWGVDGLEARSCLVGVLRLIHGHGDVIAGRDGDVRPFVPSGD